MSEPVFPSSAATEHAAESAIRDWWYGPECRLGMTSKEAARSLIWHLAKCDFAITRNGLAQAVGMRKALESIASRKVVIHGDRLVCQVCGYKSVEPHTEERHAPNCAREVARTALAAQPPAAPADMGTAMEVYDHAYCLVLQKSGDARKAEIAGVHSAINAAYDIMTSDGTGGNQPEQRTGPHRASGETNSGATGDSELTRSARLPSDPQCSAGSVPLEIEKFRSVLEPFTRLGGPNDGVMPAYHDLDDDVVIYTNSGQGITAGDVRAARNAYGILHAPWPTPVAPVERSPTYSSIETCYGCGTDQSCGEDCPNYTERKPISPSSAATEYADWAEEDYQRARDCMIGILRGHAWTIADGNGSKEFDNAFQHAVGILSLTARRLPTEPQEVWQPIETAPKDGTDFLALCEYHHKHHQMVGCFAPNGKFASWPGRNNYHPTHWVTLPASPSERLPKVGDDHTISSTCQCSPLTRYTDAPHEPPCPLSRPHQAGGGE